MVYLSTFALTFYGFHVGKYTIYTWILWDAWQIVCGDKWREWLRWFSQIHLWQAHTTCRVVDIHHQFFFLGDTSTDDSFLFKKNNNYFTSSDPHHDMLGGGCQVRAVIENMMGRMENLRTLISGFLGLVILVRWALVTMFLSWTTQTGCRIHRTYVSLIGSGEGRHTTHLLKCVLLLSTSQTDWKQSSDILSDISFDILSDISSDILSDISLDILSDISFDILSDLSSDILSDISFDMLSDISSDILSDISKPKPNIHSFTKKAALQTLYLPHTTQQK